MRDIEIPFREIEGAAERIAPIALRTPVLRADSFDAESGTRVFFKCENLQRGGAFKIRGASNFIFQIPEGDRPRGVVTFSSGNHGQAVAIASKSVGAAATVVMPLDAPRAKMDATRSHGARIVTYDRLKEDRSAIGRSISEETGATLVPPYDDPRIMAGQGTAAVELLCEIAGLDALVAPIGGGGLIAGCAIAAHHVRPAIRVFGVEPEGANDTYLSLAAGQRVEIPPPSTIADGLRVPVPGELTFPIIQRHVERVILVTEEEIRRTMKFFVTQLRIVVEPSGAAAAAAVLHRKLPAGLGSVGVIISGGNVDPPMLAGILAA
jgi:threonine dehydratase